VLEIEGEAIADFDAMRTRIGEFAPKQKVALVVDRKGTRKNLAVVLDERPDPNALAHFNPGASQNQPGPAPTPAPGNSGKSGDLYDGNPARLGVEVRETGEGVVIERVVEGGVGHRLGLRGGDVIEQVNGKAIGSIADVAGALEANRDKAEVTVKRGNGRHMAVISEG
jgi:serine protease Do